ncbi:nucleotidyltransferase domain-containing protein [Candidatus Saccharibacteria bacterium]|nr:nucleotidyltransferase domain-containing protein [Candidatus Saccharibacteria bacterium]
MLTVERIKEVVSRVGEKYGIKSAYLFGSYAKGTATEDSDVDLIIDKGKSLHKYKEYFHFCDELETELGTDVDVTTRDGMLPGFFDLVKNDRISLYGA